MDTIRSKLDVAGECALKALGLFTLFVSAPSPAADRYAGYTDSQVVIQNDNSLGIYPPSPLAGPTQAPTQPSLSGSWESWSASFVTTDHCGQAAGRTLVLCLDDHLQLSQADQLKALAYLSPGAVAFVRTDRVESYLKTVLGQMSDRAASVSISNAHLTTCAAACERVLVLEK